MIWRYSTLEPCCAPSLPDNLLTDSSVTTSSRSPCVIRPAAGQGERKEKSYRLAGGETATNPSISGRRISSCSAIQAPKEKPLIQQVMASGFCNCSQSSAVAASVSSPTPSSYLPCDLPTPRKLKRNTEKPFWANVWY